MNNARNKVANQKSLTATILVTIIVFGLISYLVYLRHEQQQKELHEQFQNEITDVTTAITAHMNAYEQVLKGARSLFLSSSKVTREEWQSYIINLELDKLYPGFQGVGFSIIVSPANLNRHEQEIRSEGFSDYRIWPEGKRDTYSGIIYLEPFDWRNQRAFGYDMFSEPTRQEAMMRARKTGKPALSGKVLLVQETNEAPQAGTLLYLPLYEKGVSLDTVEQRQQALLGWVYSPYRMSNLLQGMLGSVHPGLRLRVYDEQNSTPHNLGLNPERTERLLYDNLSATNEVVLNSEILAHYSQRLEIAGRSWLIDIDALSTFEHVGKNALYLETMGLIVIGLLLIALIWNLFRTQRKSFLNAIALSQSEKTLLDAQEKLNNTFNFSPGLICVASANTDTFIESNQTVSKILGYSVEEFTSKPFMEFIHPDDRQSTVNEIEKQLKVSSTAHYENRYQCKDGSYKWLAWYSTAADKNGKIYAVATDISEQKKLEEQLHQSKKMQAIGTLVGGIAHDFNNMLGGIIGNIYLAKQGVKDRPSTISQLKNIETLSFRASDMIQQMLAFARKGRIEKKYFSLTSFLKETSKLNEAAIPESTRVTENFCDKDLFVNADDTQLHQILLNLLSNAQDAVVNTPDPKISINLDEFDADDDFISLHPNASTRRYAHLCIVDNGIGIKNEDIEKILDPFFTTKEVGKGTGLGLSMVYGAIKSHEGILDIQSIVNQGTEVHIYLPLKADIEHSPVIDSQETVIKKGQGETILLVDDEKILLEMNKKVLENLGYHVLTAEDGLRAVEIFSNNKEIALIIMDIVMPNMGGAEAITLIRENNPDIPVIFSTGYDKEEALKSDERFEKSIVLKKPLRIEVLSQHIMEMIS